MCSSFASFLLTLLTGTVFLGHMKGTKNISSFDRWLIEFKPENYDENILGSLSEHWSSDKPGHQYHLLGYMCLTDK